MASRKRGFHEDRCLYQKQQSVHAGPGEGRLMADNNSAPLERQEDGMVPLSFVYNAQRHLPLEEQRRRLPVFAHRHEFLWAVQTSKVTLVIGETGSGKSTQLPQYLMDGNWCANQREITVCVPLKVAAMTLASRVSEERGSSLGQDVGFCTADDACGGPTTAIRYVTDGVLLRQIQADPLLLKSSVIILDDCHQRRKETDVLIGLLKKYEDSEEASIPPTCYFICHYGGPAKQPSIDSSSSTDTLRRRATRWDTSPGSPKRSETCAPESLEEMSIVEVSGRSYPVKINYLKEPCPDYIRAAYETVLHIHTTEGNFGSILVFLCGKEEIECLVELLRESQYNDAYDKRLGEIEAVPLYSALPPDGLLNAFRRPRRGARKVIVATNIAEASVTIDHVVFVVDCGFVKMNVWCPQFNINCLSIVPISQASAVQRAGRAGRTAPGVCYRLYPETSFMEHLRSFTPPEVVRTNLSHIVLYLLSLGIENFVSQVELPTPASSECLIAALSELHALEAIDDFGRLTQPLGERMAELPLDPQLARFVLKAQMDFHCGHEAIIIAAMMTCGSPWVSPPAKSRLKRNLLEACMRSIGVAEGDAVTLYNVYKQSEFYRDEDSTWDQRHMINTAVLKRAERIIKQLKNYFELWNLPIESSGSNVESICKAVCSGFFLNAARKQRDGSYRHCRTGRAPCSASAAPAGSLLPPLVIHPLSLANPKQPLLVVFHEAVAVARSDNTGLASSHDIISSAPTVTYMLNVTPIHPKWLEEVAGHFFSLDMQPGV